MNGNNRNKPCQCGSGIKTKKCLPNHSKNNNKEYEEISPLDVGYIYWGGLVGECEISFKIPLKQITPIDFSKITTKQRDG